MLCAVIYWISTNQPFLATLPVSREYEVSFRNEWKPFYNARQAIILGHTKTPHN